MWFESTDVFEYERALVFTTPETEFEKRNERNVETDVMRKCSVLELFRPVLLINTASAMFDQI